MKQKNFLITGATGETGRHTTALLLARGHYVRALAHRADARSEALKEQGAEVIIGDLLHFSDVQQALQGMNGAYFVFPVTPGIVQATAYFAQAAREAQVDTIVNMSQRPARPNAKSHASLNHWIAERVFDWSGLGVTHLRPTIFSEWLLYFAAQVGADSVVRLPFQNNKVALIAAEDQAHVIAAILEEPEPHRGQTYPLFGPIEMTFPEIVAEMSKALGREIRYEPVEREIFAQVARAGGRDEFVIQYVTEMSQDFQDGIFASMNDIVSKVGQRNPMTIQEFIGRNAAAFETNKQ